jgi:hypothetical protein
MQLLDKATFSPSTLPAIINPILLFLILAVLVCNTLYLPNNIALDSSRSAKIASGPTPGRYTQLTLGHDSSEVAILDSATGEVHFLTSANGKARIEHLDLPENATTQSRCRLVQATELRKIQGNAADSGRWRSPFRTDADHDYELMSIIVPR